MADVVALRGSAAVAQGQSEPEVVEALEDYLERAKRGEIVALCLVGVSPAGNVVTAYRNPSHWLHHMTSGAATLLYRLNAENPSLD